MKFKLIKFTFCLLILMQPTTSWCLNAYAARVKSNKVKNNKALKINDPLHVGTAIQNGDISTIDNILSKSIHPDQVGYIYHWFVVAGRQRINYKLSASTKSAVKCYKKATDLSKDQHGYFIYALSCGELIAGNMLLEGHLPEWAHRLNIILRENKDAIDSVAVHFNTTRHKVLGVGNIDFDKFERLPDMTIKRNYSVSSHVKILMPFEANNIRAKEVDQLPYIDITINGKKVHALFDTGASFSTINQADLKRLNITRSGLNYFNIKTAFTGGSLVATKLAIIKNVSVGDVDFNNAPFAIIKNGAPIVGRDLISKLGHFIRIGKKNIYFFRRRPSNIACNNRLFLNSAISGFSSSMSFLNGVVTSSGPKYFKFYLDTGANVRVFSTKKVSKTSYIQGTYSNTIGIDGKKLVREYKNKIILLINGRTRTFQMTNWPTLDLPTLYGFGALMLRNFDIGLDFSDQTGCLLLPD